MRRDPTTATTPTPSVRCHVNTRPAVGGSISGSDIPSCTPSITTRRGPAFVTTRRSPPAFVPYRTTTVTALGMSRCHRGNGKDKRGSDHRRSFDHEIHDDQLLTFFDIARLQTSRATAVPPAVQRIP